MGLLKAGAGALQGLLADQWRDYYYCDAMGQFDLVRRAKRRTSSRSVNRGSANIISNGSVIAVNEGQAALIIDGGKIVECVTEAGEFVWNDSSESSVFSGDLGQSISGSIRKLGERISFGGLEVGDQRVYYINTTEIMDNSYFTKQPIPYRVVSENIGLDVDVAVRCRGSYSYRVTDPVMFYKNVCANVSGVFSRIKLEDQFTSDLLTALQPALARISALGVRYSDLPGYTEAIADALNELLTEKWGKTRGISVVSFGIDSIAADAADGKMIRDLQRTAVFRDASMAGAEIVSAQGDAMRSAAANEATGPVMAFAGMHMAQRAGGASLQKTNRWVCACGKVNQSKFCEDCGAKQPDGWMCSCGHVNQGKFCEECGAKKPAEAPQHRCDKCGWEPEDPLKAPKFCPECGDAFNGNDIV